MNSCSVKLLWVFPIAATLLEAQPSSVTITDHTAVLHASDPRPLAEALFQLSRVLKTTVGFEEARLHYRGDLVDMTSPSYVSKSQDDRVYFPRGGALDITFTIPSDTGPPSDPAPVIRQLLAEYRARGYPGRYAFESRPDPNGYIYVYPEAVADDRGLFGKADPMTKANVSIILRENETLIGAIQDVLTQLSTNSARQVVIGGTVVGAFVQPAALTLKNGKEPAFLFFNSTAVIANHTFWQVLYDPTEKFHVLSYRH